MDFSAGVHDVICTRKKLYWPRLPPRSILIFLVHITSCTPAEKSIIVYCGMLLILIIQFLSYPNDHKFSDRSFGQIVQTQVRPDCSSIAPRREV